MSFLRLKASVNISTLPTQARIIAQALKDYGMILADNGSPWYISGVPDERWDNNILHQIGNIHGSDFEAVDVSSLQVDPDSGQVATAGYPVPPPGAFRVWVPFIE